MEILIHEKWWREGDNLVLVAKSIGNKASGIDTIKYEIVKLNEKELELKNSDITIKFNKN